MKITVLSDNLTTTTCLAEHGYAALVVADGKRILFDTGAGGVIAENAQRLGIRLARLDAIVLSHGHRDHCGGLPKVLELSGPTRIVAHPAIFCRRVQRRRGRYVSSGIPFSRDYVESLGGRFLLTRKSYRLTSRIFTTGQIRRTTDFERIPKVFKLHRNGRIVPDPFLDDLALCIGTARGIAIVTGCGHAGLVNIIRHVSRLAAGQPIAAVFGGAHLAGESEPRVRGTIEELTRRGIRKVALSHCTGVRVMCRLARDLPPGRFDFVNAGDCRRL